MITREALLKLEKAELHVHLEGTVTPPLLRTLAERNNIDLATPVRLPSSPESITPPPGLRDGTFGLRDFRDFIGIYVKIVETVRSDNDIVTIATAMLESAQRENIRAIECYFSPSNYSLFGVKPEQLFDGLIAAQQIGCDRFGISLRWIFDIVRNTSVDGMEVVNFALRARSQGVDVPYIGLAGYEAAVRASKFTTAFERARAEGFKTLAHAGETAGAESVRETLELLRPDRIGHGIRAIEDPRVLEMLVEQQIPIEVSPWSNIALQITPPDKHPLRKMIEAGVNVVLCSDDPGIFQRDLTDNFMYAAENGVSLKMLEWMASQSLKLAQR